MSDFPVRVKVVHGMPIFFVYCTEIDYQIPMSVTMFRLSVMKTCKTFLIKRCIMHFIRLDLLI